MKRYNPKDIEPRWQGIWEETGVYTADLQSDKPKYFAMSMFNYPSGNLHIGHAMNFTISDVKARFKRQQGFESYHPVGWDSFGLPAENRAIKEGISPQESMAQLIPDYHKAYKAMGWSNDWEKEISTHLPEYYKWTQWIFSKMYEHGLAYQDSRLQWWCAIDNTVLANEQVIDGKCWRHDGPDDPLVEKKEVKQWFFKITDYADELLDAVDDLDWTESVKLAQKNWIGRSQGAEIDFGLDFGAPKVNESIGPDGKKPHITVFTTRPDTLYGATYLVLAPEHRWVELALEHQTVLSNNDEVADYIRQANAKSEVERQTNQKDKTGVKLEGVQAINPINGEKIPIWIADYVLTGYGTGAIMAVPAHDERDHEFAKKYELPIKPVLTPSFIARTSADVDQALAVDRAASIVIGHDPESDKYCLIKWPEGHYRAGLEWPGGGMDEGESIEQAALREFAEETGYDDAVVDKVLSAAISFYYRDVNDGSPTRTIKNIVKLNLKSQAHGDEFTGDDYEKDAYEVLWLSRSEVLSRLDQMDDSFQAITRFAFEGTIHIGEGVMINSGEYDNLPSDQAREKIVADLAEKGVAQAVTNYRMRDWSVGRQRYWGVPIPMIHCPKCGAVPVPEADLPVVLPELTDFQPSGDGRSALARAKDWLVVDCPKCGGQAERETDTLDTYICSSWYMLRYLDPHNQAAIFDSETANHWMPVDFYNGADHATAHLLYARFVTRFFSKIGLVENPEPFKQMLYNGKVTAADGSAFSKSKGNGVDPLEIIAQGYGADALRTYLMFAAPLELATRWDPQGVPGTHRFLSRLWNLAQEYLEAKDGELTDEQVGELRRSTHSMIKKVTTDLEDNHYNTAIAAAMACLNDFYKFKTQFLVKSGVWQESLEALIACVAPFAPHITDELWQQLGHSSSIQKDSWPKFNEDFIKTDSITIAVQVNGKLRGEVEVEADASEDTVVEAAKAPEKVAGYLEGQTIKKTIYVPGKLVNFVI